MSSTRLFYVDDSGASQTGYSVYSWCELAVGDWVPALTSWLDVRAVLATTYGIPKNAELHATQLVNGRGRPSLDPDFNESMLRRRQAMADCMGALAVQPWLSYGTVYSVGAQKDQPNDKMRTYLELVRTIDKRLRDRDEYGILVMDGDGTEDSYITAHRQLELRSRRLIEDPSFQHSNRSQWVQIADLIAYSAYQNVLRLPAKRWSSDWYPTLAPRDVLCGPKRV